MYELIELTDGELDAVSGGNPFSINLSRTSSASVGSSISATLSTAFTNMPVLSQSNGHERPTRLHHW